MHRLIIFVLAFVLAGVPAAAVVCDLILCVKPQESQCHQHASPRSGEERLVASADACTHLALTAPYARSALRVFFDHVAPAASFADTWRPETGSRGMRSVSPRGSPPAPLAVHSPLRI